MGAKKTISLGAAKLGVPVIELDTNVQCKTGSCNFIYAIECAPADGGLCTADGCGNVGARNSGSDNFGEGAA